RQRIRRHPSSNRDWSSAVGSSDLPPQATPGPETGQSAPAGPAAQGDGASPGGAPPSPAAYGQAGADAAGPYSEPAASYGQAGGRPEERRVRGEGRGGASRGPGRRR